MIRAMTALRHISLPVHGAIEMLGGLALMAAPFVLGFGLAATVFGIVLGVLVVGLALQSVDDGRPTRYGAHRDADLGLSIGLGGAAVVVGLTGDAAAAVFFAAMALAGLVLNQLTRYTPQRGVTRIQNFPQ